MNWIAYLPPLFSIYLTLVSGFARMFLVSSVGNLAGRKKALSAHQDVIENVALSWSTRLNLFNAMIAAVFSLASTFARSRSYEWFVAGVAAILLLLPPVVWYLFSLGADELTTVRTRWGVKVSTVCKFLLILVNLILIVGIAAGQRAAAWATDAAGESGGRTAAMPTANPGPAPHLGPVTGPPTRP